MGNEGGGAGRLLEREDGDNVVLALSFGLHGKSWGIKTDENGICGCMRAYGR